MKTGRSVIAALLAIGFAGSTAAMAAEPANDLQAAGDSAEAPQIWGDPEEERAEEGWTWFGMGYEQRTRAAGAGAVPGNAGLGGVQNRHKARRK